MNNMMSSVNQVETPHIGTSDSKQQSVSPFYSSATSLQYVNPNMPVDRGIGHATTSYPANYPQSSYATPHATNFLAPYATMGIHNSASHLHANSRISENSIGSHVSSPSIVAYNVFPAQLQNFSDISLPKESKTVGGQFYPDWVIKKNLTSFWDKCNVALHE